MTGTSSPVPGLAREPVHHEDPKMRANPLMLAFGLLIVVVVVVAAIRLGGNLGRGEDQKEFPPHAVQQ